MVQLPAKTEERGEDGVEEAGDEDGEVSADEGSVEPVVGEMSWSSGFDLRERCGGFCSAAGAAAAAAAISLCFCSHLERVDRNECIRIDRRWPSSRCLTSFVNVELLDTESSLSSQGAHNHARGANERRRRRTWWFRASVRC